MKTKILSLLFAALIASVGTMSAANYSGSCGTDLIWTLNTNDSVLNIYGSGEMEDYSSSTNSPWYSYRRYIKTISFPVNITSIGNYAFYNCTNLISVSLSENVTEIGDYAFRTCPKLSSIILNNGLERVGNYSFYDCKCKELTSITIPSSVSSIGEKAFSSGFIDSVVVNCENPPTLGTGAFPRGETMIDNSSGMSEIVNITATIYVPCEFVSAYQSLWNKYSSQITSIPFPYTIGILMKSQGKLLDTKNNLSVVCDEGFKLSAPTYYGYHFVRWDDGVTDNPRSVDDVVSNKIFTVEYAINYYSLSVSCDSDKGSVSPVIGEYAHASEVLISASPNQGYIFKRWSDANTDNPRTITITNNTEISAIFVEENPLKSISVNGEPIAIADSMIFFDAHDDSYIPQIEVTASSITATATVAQLDKADYGWYVIIRVAESNNSIKEYKLFIINSIIKHTARITLTGEDRTSFTISTDNDAFGSVVGSTLHQYRSDEHQSSFLNQTGYKLGNRPSHIGMLFTSNALQEGDIVSVLMTKESNIGEDELFFYSDEGNTPLCTIKGVYSPGLYSFELGSNAPQLRAIYLYRKDMEMNPHVAYLEVTRISSVYNYSISSDESKGSVSMTNKGNIVIAHAIPNAGYSFSQWNDGNTDNPRTITLTQDTLLVAEFTQNAISRYQVQFVDWDGTILHTDSVDYGASATAPANPTREGYMFSGWDKAFDNVTEDMVVTAQYTINRYQVQFVDWDGTILHTDSVDYGASTTAPANPTREGYTFTGWNKEVTSVTQDMVVTALYAINHYNISVNCNNIQGTIEGESGEFDYMSTLTYRAIPNEGYIFTQWGDGITDNPRTITLTQDTTLTAEFAEDYILAAGTCGEYLTWTLTRDSILTIEGYGNMTSHPWTSYKLYIKIVSLPDGLTNTCKEAFRYCSNLTSVTIPNSVTTIGEYAFANCSSLISITIPNSVTNIGRYAFQGCTGLTSVILGYSVTTIEKNVFRDCSSLVSITIPNSVTSIGNDVFTGCTSLMSIYVPCGELDRFNTMLRNDSRVQYTPLPYSITTTAVNGIINVPICYEEPIQITAIPNAGYIFTQWSDGITDNPRTITLTQDTMFTAKFSELSIDGLVYSFDTNKQTAELIRVANKNIASIIIPNTVVYNNSTYTVVAIGQDAFRNCRALTSVTIGENITTIQAGAFSGCDALSSISIPNNVISIGQDAFRNCTSLSSADIGNNVAEIGISAFDGCTQLSQITLPHSINVIGSTAFKNCSELIEIVIPTNVTSIGNNVFYGCSGLRTIVWNAANCTYSNTSSPFNGIASQITSFTIGESVEYIPTGLCYNFINLDSIIISNSVTSIGKQAFSGCSNLASITIPNSVTNIGTEAFRGCSKLTSVIIPNSVTSIGEKAFAYCTKLEDVTVGTGITALGRSVFSTSASIKRVQWNAINYRQVKPAMDSNSFPFYASRDSISSFVFGEGVNYVPEYLLKDFSAIQSLVIPASVTNIDRYAFANDSLAEMTCLAEIPPTIDSTAIVGMNTSTCILYVPYSSVNTYRNAKVWKEFANIRATGAEEVEEPEDDIVITPSNTTASIIWTLISNAVSYELVIRDMNGNVICTLTFNAYGQLTGIAFAPNRKRESQQTQVAGFQFTVSGLENGTTYEYEFNAKDENDNIIETFTGTFTTTNDTPTSVENTPENMLNVPKKVIYNNQIYIIRGEKTYTLQGQEVK